MARKRRKQHLIAGELNLTAMIDVAFQLLSFFIMASHPVDVFTNMNVFRPSQESEQVRDNAPPPNVIRIMIYKDAYTINENPIDFKNLDKVMGKLSVHDKNQTILIMCRKESKHRQLIDVLDMCAKLKLTNLSVISSN
jgi:biopolymer transport protein ExbD